jgi:hypothetical protein
MKRTTLFFAVALCCSLAATAWAATATHTVSSKASANKAGTKDRPAKFLAGYRYDVTVDDGSRPSAPQTWTWKWDGVQLNGADFPKCTSEMIDAAQSDSVCPKGSLVAQGPIEAKSGPDTDPNSNFTCTGKVIKIYNAGAKEQTFYADGPPENCAGLTYLAPAKMRVKTSKGTSSTTLVFPDNLVHPLPGISSGLTFFDVKYFPRKTTKGKGKKKRTVNFMSSSKCSDQRKFTMTVVDDEGTRTLHADAGAC